MLRVRPLSLRWIAVIVFVFSSVLNYLDRQVLATMIDVWRDPKLPVHPDFTLTLADYGTMLTVFSISYALAAPFMGLLLDKLGLTTGIVLSVALWSGISLLTGFVHSFEQLLWCRAALGIVEASGISAFGKMGGAYLLPKERAVGAALSQVGLSVGAGLAPRLVTTLAYEYNWQWAFYAAGILGFLWIPLWLITSWWIPPTQEDAPGDPAVGAVSFTHGDMLRDSRLWALVIANFLSMTVYTLWINWTPPYLVRVHHLSPKEAVAYSWIVPICGYFGAFIGGSLSWWLVGRGMSPVAARKRVCLLAAVFVLMTAAVPLMPTPALATLGMSVSFFWIAAWSTNLYTLPVDIYGATHAAFGVSALVFAYGAMQAVISKPLGRVIELYGFGPVCLLFALLPLLSYILLGMFVHTENLGARPALAPETALPLR